MRSFPQMPVKRLAIRKTSQDKIFPRRGDRRQNVAIPDKTFAAHEQVLALCFLALVI